MAANDVAQVLFQLLDGRIAFALVACRDDEDEGFVLGARLQEFVNQPCSDTKPKATTGGSIKRAQAGNRYTNLLAPVTRT
jgi:hypothetical protein